MEGGKTVQKTLPVSRVIVSVDSREANSHAFEHLKKYECTISMKSLEVGDYIASERVGIEKKTVQDFLGSMFDQRLFRQLGELKNSYEAPVLIIEGNPELLFLEGNVHPNAIRGCLASIAVDYKVPILWTRNGKETAAQIYWIAYREQVLEKKPISVRAEKRPVDFFRQQEYLVAGLPNVNSVMSRRLLEHYRTPKRLFSATEGSLKRVDGIGELKAKKIWEMLNREYSKNDLKK
jgi:Fanconi anemia group M protein